MGMLTWVWGAALLKPAGTQACVCLHTSAAEQSVRAGVGHGQIPVCSSERKACERGSKGDLDSDASRRRVIGM